MKITTQEVCQYKVQQVDIPKPFNQFKRNVNSQNGEDGVLEAVIQKIGISNKFFVEFGGFNGVCCSNTAYLRTNHNWTGVLFEGDKNITETNKNTSLNLFNEYITSKNINDIFKRYNIPDQFGLLSIDIDSNDIYVLEALDQRYRPDLIIIEYNPGLPNVIPIRIEEDKSNIKQGYFNANLNDMYNVGKIKNYEMITTVAYNAIFIRDEIYSKLEMKRMTKEECLLINDKENYKNEWMSLIKKYDNTWIIPEYK